MSDAETRLFPVFFGGGGPMNEPRVTIDKVYMVKVRPHKKAHRALFPHELPHHPHTPALGGEADAVAAEPGEATAALAADPDGGEEGAGRAAEGGADAGGAAPAAVAGGQ